MKKSNLNKLIKEELNININYIISNLISQGYKLNEKYSNNKRFLLIKNNNKQDSSVDIYLDQHPDFKYYVSCQSKVIIDSQSLADPTKNYQTTSAEKIKYRTINNRDYFNNIEEVDKFIQKFLKKVNKLVA